MLIITGRMEIGPRHFGAISSLILLSNQKYFLTVNILNSSSGDFRTLARISTHTHTHTHTHRVVVISFVLFIEIKYWPVTNIRRTNRNRVSLYFLFSLSLSLSLSLSIYLSLTRFFFSLSSLKQTFRAQCASF